MALSGGNPVTITFLHINGVTMKGMTYRNDKTGEATVEHTCDARAVFDKLAIIVVTYKRQQLLEELLASFAQLTVAGIAPRPRSGARRRYRDFAP